jgi:hypothetical protein
VPSCPRDDQGAYLVDPTTGSHAMPNAETELCFALRTDPVGLTPDPLDDIAPYCLEIGANLEFELAYVAGAVVPSGASLRATCVSSKQPEIDCPQP